MAAAGSVVVPEAVEKVDSAGAGKAVVAAAKAGAAEDSEPAPVSLARTALGSADEARVSEAVKLAAADVAPKVANAEVKAEANSPSRTASAPASECSSY